MGGWHRWRGTGSIANRSTKDMAMRSQVFLVDGGEHGGLMCVVVLLVGWVGGTAGETACTTDSTMCSAVWLLVDGGGEHTHETHMQATQTITQVLTQDTIKPK